MPKKAGSSGEGAVRTRADGTGEARRRHLKPLLERAGVPPMRPYDLRHTFAILWLESGESVKILQEILGHSRITLTLDTYAHVTPHMQREAFGRFGQGFSSSS